MMDDAEHDEMVVAVEAHLATMDWRPIETAPKDVDVLVYNGLVGIYLSRHNATPHGCNEWPCFSWDGRGGTWYPVPTHWMQLPQPPLTETRILRNNCIARDVDDPDALKAAVEALAEYRKFGGVSLEELERELCAYPARYDRGECCGGACPEGLPPCPSSNQAMR